MACQVNRMPNSSDIGADVIKIIDMNSISLWELQRIHRIHQVQLRNYGQLCQKNKIGILRLRYYFYWLFIILLRRVAFLHIYQNAIVF